MPFLVRGKARARQNRPNPPPIALPPEPLPFIAQEPELETSSPEESTVAKQEVTYRVPKEERLLDLPLEEEILEEEEAGDLDERTYNVMPVDNPVSIGAVLKKKKRR